MKNSTGEWRTTCRQWLGVLLVLVVAAPVGAAIKELSNDSFAGAGTATCVTGPAEGLSAAAKLTADPTTSTSTRQVCGRTPPTSG